MQPDPTDLLNEAKSDPPPARYGVDDVVAAGQRRRRHRNAGLALAAVTAVAVAIGVPQIATRHSANRPAPVVGVTGTAYQFDFPFQGYTAAGYRVYDPTEADLPGAGAAIQKIGIKDPQRYQGALRVYRAGIDPLTFYPGRTPVEQSPIDGRPAYAESSDDGTPTMFAWQFTAGRWAAIFTAGHEVDRATVRKIAEGFTAGAARPATNPLTIGWVPSGYRLAGGRAWPDTGNPGRPATAAMTFFSDRMVNGLLTEPGRGAARLTEKAPDQGVFVSLSSLPSKPYPTGPTCEEATMRCSVGVDGGRFLLAVRSQAVSSGEVSTGDLLRMLESITVADLTLTSDWSDLSTAVPVAARLPEQ